MQRIALSDALRQQPDDRITVFEKFGHAAGYQRIAFRPGFLRLLRNNPFEGLVLTGGLAKPLVAGSEGTVLGIQQRTPSLGLRVHH